MAIVTHPDGYLQITEGHNWQDVSDNGILQRIFKGWNERRLVAGLPLYWYGKNPNASILLGGDAQFTEFENPLTVPNPTYTIEDARIYPGANLQNTKFWKVLYRGLPALSTIQPFYDYPSDNSWDTNQFIIKLQSGKSYTDIIYAENTFFQSVSRLLDEINSGNVRFSSFDLSWLNKDALEYINVQKEFDIKHGDIISAKLINNLLRYLYQFETCLNQVLYISNLKSGGVNGVRDNLGQAFDEANSEWYKSDAPIQNKLKNKTIEMINSITKNKEDYSDFTFFSISIIGNEITEEKFDIQYFEKAKKSTLFGNCGNLFDSPILNCFDNEPYQTAIHSFTPLSDKVSYQKELTGGRELTLSPLDLAPDYDKSIDDDLLTIEPSWGTMAFFLATNYQFADLPAPTQ